MTAAGISYMGTKRELAGSVASIIASAKPGIMLDAFAGMGAVAQAVSGERNVWLNDIQMFAHLVGKCLFTSRENPKPAIYFSNICKDDYTSHYLRALARNPNVFASCVATISADSFIEFNKSLAVGVDATVECSEYYCFFDAYRQGFFSAHQSAQIDSIRYAIDIAKRSKKITHSQWEWAIIALGRSCLRVANTPGHFAQYLTPSEANFRRVQKQWKRSVWDEWLNSLGLISSVGTVRWRALNKVTNQDSMTLLSNVKNSGVGVVYCDPPYTNDQYSRYYHIWETLIAYDYPIVKGAGRYREDRFTTPFSIKTKSINAMSELIGSASECGADVVLSYPSNGLVYEAGGDPRRILEEHFRLVSMPLDLSHSHSTFGASKGKAKSEVREQVFYATNKRR